MKRQAIICALTSALALAACGPAGRDKEDAAGNISNDAPGNLASPVASSNAAEPPGKSIIRPSIVDAPASASRAEPVSITIPFPDRGMKLDAEGQDRIDKLLAEPVMAEEGPIILRGHSDARGSDADNLAASRHRAEAVKDYLLSRGVAQDRISIIALGEYRPVAPSAKADGSDDPEGRAKNRRVEIEVGLPPPVIDPAPPGE
ncbi:OmpA family protein [Sphingobium cloacae]|uniref:OmpA-like domain-containing protein n=1 Tax=Sphingobium cloacae TaxID=120107 RepID=A0A1E1EYN3_9SPHN|nr:OmpA family protein [Sphingobium cloacae]BAV63369.1 hypothetical protein SCLO_1003290 [Sphingobium cloacae]